MRVKYVLNEVLVGLWRNVTMTVAMIITMSVSLAMLGASVLLYMQVDQMKSYYYGEIEVSVFLKNDITDTQMICVERNQRCLLLMSNSGVGHRVFPPLLKAALGDVGMPWTWEYGSAPPAAAP